MDRLISEFGRDISTTDKWHLLKLLLVFNTVIAFGFMFSSFFVEGIWGNGAYCQVALTSLCYFAYSGYLLSLVQRQEIVHGDFLGGVALMMNLLLFQTAALWGDIAGGMNFNPEIMQTISRRAERAVCAFATLNFIAHMILSYLVFLWKQELLGFSSAGADAHFGSGNSDTPYAGIGDSETAGYQASSTAADIAQDFSRSGEASNGKHSIL
mmetsp:Transcript_13709/g.16610  ORF Transcript_13709/g.16610 Transcript_13709/m.16610 type:complete len:211 (-) Transcript_13709:293-925(-)